MTFLPYGRQSIDDEDVRAVTAVLKGDMLTTGPTIARFEDAFAKAVGARHAVACSSGTAALHLAAMAADLGPGGRAIVPAVTFAATANAAHYVGADVVIADVTGENGLMTPALLRESLSRPDAADVKVVLPVHLAGQCADPAAIRDLADASGAMVIEDACHALGASWRGSDGREHRVGDCSHSDMAVFSFHPVKTIAMGEGGAITTNDDVLARRLRALRTHGMEHDPDAFEDREAACDEDGLRRPWYMEMQALGFNYRASDIHCALGLSQLGRLPEFVARRRALAAVYDDLLAGLSPRLRPITRIPACDAVWHLYVVLIDYGDAGTTRARFMAALREREIGSQVHYIPLYRHPYFVRRYGQQSRPGAEAYYDRALSLPLHVSMTEADVVRVCAVLAELLDV